MEQLQDENESIVAETQHLTNIERIREAGAVASDYV